MINLLYIHIGKNLPEYIYDSIYQSLLVSPDTKIYVILDDTLIMDVKNKIKQFDTTLYNKNNKLPKIEYIPISILNISKDYIDYIDNLPDSTKAFRDAFWVSTTARFFYIEAFMKLFCLEHVIHIENDIMLYENLDSLPLDYTKLYMVRDCEGTEPRVIPSIVYIPNHLVLNKLTTFMLSILLNSNRVVNDMELLGRYSDDDVMYFPFDFNTELPFIMDGAAIGQFLGGIDPRNLNDFNAVSPSQQEFLRINNPSKGFINEKSTFKPNTVNIFTKKMHMDNTIVPIDLVYASQEKDEQEQDEQDEHVIKLKQIMNLHIHSKQLNQFSSINNLKFDDIITGDRIINLCDFIITTTDILNYHLNLQYFIEPNKIIVIQNFENINFINLNSYLNEINKPVVKLFVYSHLLDGFINYILPNLDKSLEYILYLHNSDYGLCEQHHFDILSNAKCIKHVYSQNISFYSPDKFSLLPIGLANSMFAHGNLITFYNAIKETYYLKKTKGLYINVNTLTYRYRKDVLDEINKRNDEFEISSGKKYPDYLKELSTHRFCLCIRGNGISCHREWESLYLGVIPVIINNKYTENMSAYVKYLTDLNLPFYEITEDTLDKYSDDFFNEELYKKIIYRCDSSIFNSPALKRDFYSA